MSRLEELLPYITCKVSALDGSKALEKESWRVELTVVVPSIATVGNLGELVPMKSNKVHCGLIRIYNHHTFINSNVENPVDICSIRYFTSIDSCWPHCIIPSTQDDWAVTPVMINVSTHISHDFTAIWKSPCTTSLSSCCSGAASCSISQTEQSTTALSYVTKQHYTVVRENSAMEEETNTW